MSNQEQPKVYDEVRDAAGNLVAIVEPPRIFWSLDHDERQVTMTLRRVVRVRPSGKGGVFG